MRLEWLSGNMYNKIYIDMDGVLVDFEKGIGKLVREAWGRKDSYETGIRKKMKRVGSPNIAGQLDDPVVKDLTFALIKVTPEFFENLEWMPDGPTLWSYVKRYNPTVLTSPVDDASIIGKRKWCVKNLGLDDDRVIMERDKYKYATPDSILIDDQTNRTIPWEEAGGIAILHTDAASTIEKLRELL